MIKAVNRGAVNIYDKIHFLLISENECFHEIKNDGITSLHGIYVVILTSCCKCYSVYHEYFALSENNYYYLCRLLNLPRRIQWIVIRHPTFLADDLGLTP